MKRNKADQNDPILLKQKLIYYQSELSLYKEKVKKYENMNRDNNKRELEKELESRNHEIFKLKEMIDELEAENVILKEVAGHRNEENESTKQLKYQIIELQQKLADLEKELEKKKKIEIKLDENQQNQGVVERQHSFSNTWFINNLKNQQAINLPRTVQYKHQHYPSSTIKPKINREENNE